MPNEWPTRKFRKDRHTTRPQPRSAICCHYLTGCCKFGAECNWTHVRGDPRLILCHYDEDCFYGHGADLAPIDMIANVDESQGSTALFYEVGGSYHCTESIEPGSSFKAPGGESTSKTFVGRSNMIGTSGASNISTSSSSQGGGFDSSEGPATDSSVEIVKIASNSEATSVVSQLIPGIKETSCAISISSTDNEDLKKHENEDVASANNETDNVVQSRVTTDWSAENLEGNDFDRSHSSADWGASPWSWGLQSSWSLVSTWSSTWKNADELADEDAGKSWQFSAEGKACSGENRNTWELSNSSTDDTWDDSQLRIYSYRGDRTGAPLDKPYRCRTQEWNKNCAQIEEAFYKLDGQWVGEDYQGERQWHEVIAEPFKKGQDKANTKLICRTWDRGNNEQRKMVYYADGEILFDKGRIYLESVNSQYAVWRDSQTSIKFVWSRAKW